MKIILPYTFVLEVLGELSGYDPDILHEFMATYAPAKGKSWAEGMRHIGTGLSDDVYTGLFGATVGLEGVTLDREPRHEIENVIGVYLDAEFLDQNPGSRNLLDGLETFDPPSRFEAMNEDDDMVCYIDPTIINENANPDNPEPTARELMAGALWDTATAMLKDWKPALLEEH